MEKDEKLVQYIEKIERLQNDKKLLLDEINQVYNELKNNGYSVKAVKDVIKLRKMHSADRDEFEYERKKYIETI